ncbi:condensation domain-containing protein [Rhodococcus sp. HNM0569]|uniref:condensation domain-containing protein n=1 Tax=Rhodococcus sp. HNM0569 TaxID=2716340 RepID=UPI00146CD221|nr:condensation domain-containing protein [Rhodococcus sp. HNM0569]NLU81886.1 acyltransferase [Rhodococcus sp. HNM0569]
MDLNLITHWQPRPGRVVDWTASVDAARAAVDAPIAATPATTMQERHLRRARATAERGEPQSPWIGLAFDFDGPFDVDVVTRTLEHYVRRHDTLHSRFEFVDADDAPDALVRKAVAPADITLSASDPAPLGTAEAVRDHIAARFASETSALAWPAFVFGAVVHDDDTFTLFHAVDHAHTDMMSMLLTYAEIRTIHDAIRAGHEPDLPAPGSYVEYSTRERERAAALTPQSPEVVQWAGHLMASGGSFPGFPLDLGVADGPKPAIGSRFDLADAAECDRFGARCKELGANFVGGVFAALAVAERELAGRERYLALSPVSTRENDFLFAQGWFINLVPVLVDGAGATSFAELAARGQAAFRAGKAVGAVSAQQALETVTGAAGTAAGTAGGDLTPPPIVSYIDGRRVPDNESFVSTRATGIVGGKDTTIASLWVNRVAEGTWMAISHPDTPAAHESVGRYAERVSQVIRTVAATGDYTISVPGGTDAVAPEPSEVTA